MRVYNVCTFFNELDVLDIRLRTLADQVDTFVLAEANTDQRGRPKPYHLDSEEARAIVAPYDVRVVRVEDMPDGPDHWLRENWQRSALSRGLHDLAYDDVVLISDMDEIPHPDALAEGIAEPGLRYPMDMHVYRLDWRWTERPVTDGSTAVTRPGSYVASRSVHWALLDPYEARWRTGAGDLVVSSGWHLAYQYDQDGIAAKVQSIADNAWAQLVPIERKNDTEFWAWDESVQTMAPTRATLDACVERGLDVYGRDHRAAERVGLDQLPPCVAADPGRYAHMLAGGAA